MTDREERDLLLGVVPGPRWKDECHHAPGEYVGTVRCVVRIHDSVSEEVVDVYAFDKSYATVGGTNFCLRYGDEPSEYHGPGDVVSLSNGAHAGMEVYAAALRLLMARGRFVWERKVENGPVV